MTTESVLEELARMGTEQTKKTFLRHGAREPLFGVKVGDLKTLQKKLKKNYELSLELYATGNSDAMYLAMLIADEKQMTRKDLEQWVKGANWSMMSDCAVPWIAAESAYGWELGLQWIESPKEYIACAGWSTMSSVFSVTPDGKIDLAKVRELLSRVEREVHSAPNRVRHAMNCFVIAAGSFVAALTEDAKRTARKIGSVHVDQGDTACKEPNALAYIEKVEAAGRIGKKKKMARC